MILLFTKDIKTLYKWRNKNWYKMDTKFCNSIFTFYFHGGILYIVESYLLSITMSTYIQIFLLKKKKHRRFMNERDIVVYIICITTQLFFSSFTFNEWSVPRFQYVEWKQIIRVVIRRCFVAIKRNFVDVERTLESDLVS